MSQCEPKLGYRVRPKISNIGVIMWRRKRKRRRRRKTTTTTTALFRTTGENVWDILLMT